MKKTAYTKNRLRIALVALLTFGALLAPNAVKHAQAATSTTPFSLTVTGGALSIATQATTVTGSAITLNGYSQNSTATLSNVSIVDSRGSGAGWTNQVQTADLSTTITGTSYQIPYTGLTLGAQSPIISDTSSSPASGLAASINTLGGTDTTPGVTLSGLSTLLVAGLNNGLGSYTDTVSMTQVVPAKTRTFAGGATVYSTNLVFSVQ